MAKTQKKLEGKQSVLEKLRKKEIEEYCEKFPEKAAIFNSESIKKTSRTDDIIKEINIYQGKRLKLLRHSYDLSIKQLADVMGISANQVKKYESGINRLSGARLYMLAEKIKNGGDPKFNINYFFEGINFKYFETHEGSVLFSTSSFLDRTISLGLMYENIIINFLRLKNPKNITSIKNLIKKFVKLETFEQKKDESGVEKGD